LDPAAAFEAASALDRVLAERGLLGLGLEAMRREARQQRRQARAQACEALRQHEQAAAQWARAVSRVGSAARPAASRRFAKSANGSDRPA
jgi:hypothetical protein